MPLLTEPPPAAAPARVRPPRRSSARRPEEAVPHRPTVLRDVSWETYRTLREAPGNAHVKLTYDGPNGGLLEIEMPTGSLHEIVKSWLGDLVTALCEERKIDHLPTGEVTQGREELGRGLEGDESFYFAGKPLLRDPDDIDLDAGDPPPDLAVEVDVTSPGVSKLPIYAALGVPEVWVWADGAITVRRLGEAGEYREAGESAVLPGFPIGVAASLIERRNDAAHHELLAEFRAAVKSRN